jgi:hypothetical protein
MNVRTRTRRGPLEQKLLYICQVHEICRTKNSVIVASHSSWDRFGAHTDGCMQKSRRYHSGRLKLF